MHSLFSLSGTYVSSFFPIFIYSVNKNQKIETDRIIWAINLENQNRAVNSLARHGEKTPVDLINVCIKQLVVIYGRSTTLTIWSNTFQLLVKQNLFLIP